MGDLEVFAEKINQLAESPRLQREMGEYNRAKVEGRFTLERMVLEYENLFQQVLEKKRKSKTSESSLHFALDAKCEDMAVILT